MFESDSLQPSNPRVPFHNCLLKTNGDYSGKVEELQDRPVRDCIGVATVLAAVGQFVYEVHVTTGVHEVHVFTPSMSVFVPWALRQLSC